MKAPATVLVVGGLDPSGRAGLAADLRALAHLGLYGAPIASALTVQGEGPVEAHAVEPGLFGRQLGAALRSQAPAAVKVGLLPDARAVQALIDALAPHPGLPMVLDPVLQASSGPSLVAADLRAALPRLFGRCRLLTPNLDEAAALLGRALGPDLEAEALALCALGAPAVLLKGGHSNGPQSTDILAERGRTLRLEAPRLASPNTRGTGCTLASLIAGGLAQGEPLEAACRKAKNALSALLERNAGLRWPGGPGPVLPGA